MQGLEQPHVQMGTERIIHEYEIYLPSGSILRQLTVGKSN